MWVVELRMWVVELRMWMVKKMKCNYEFEGIVVKSSHRVPIETYNSLRLPLTRMSS